MRRTPPAELLDALKNHFHDRFSQSRSVLDQHGRDESPYDPVPPDAVVYAHTTDEVAQIVRLCAEYKTPLIAFGAGSSIEGHLHALQGGVCLNLTQMNQVKAVHAEDMVVTVEAGVTRKQLNEEIRYSGLFFPIDPGADATIGGMTATRASGTNAVRYGTMRDNVLALTVVTAQGKVIRTASRARKSSAGYDLTRLFVGSEGTLGIITEITLRLYPQPQAVSAAVCSFPSVADATNTVIATVQYGIPVARAELLDALTVKAVNQYSKTTLKEQPMLFLEFHGSEEEVKAQAQIVKDLANERGANGFEWATHEEDRSRLWNARHMAFFACLQLRPGSRGFTTDACVPISRLAECIEQTIADTKNSSLPCPVFGHVGDGNFHCVIVADPHKKEEMQEAEALNQRIMQRAISMNGTCTGEHGVGRHKIDMLVHELGEDNVALQRQIKAVFDPDQILNPGKIFS